MNPATSGSTPSASVRPAGAQRWRVWFPDETVFGPLTSDELKELVKQKVLTIDCRLQREGKTDWLLPSQIFPRTFPAAPRPPTPSQGSQPAAALPVPPNVSPPAAGPAFADVPTTVTPPPSVTQDVPILAEVASLPMVHAPTTTPPGTSSTSAEEGLGMLLFGGIGVLLLLAIFGLGFQFFEQQGWEAPNSPVMRKMLLRGGIGVVCVLAGLGAFVAKTAFGGGEERTP